MIIRNELRWIVKDGIKVLQVREVKSLKDEDVTVQDTIGTWEDVPTVEE